MTTMQVLIKDQFKFVKVSMDQQSFLGSVLAFHVAVSMALLAGCSMTNGEKVSRHARRGRSKSTNHAWYFVEGDVSKPVCQTNNQVSCELRGEKGH